MINSFLSIESFEISQEHPVQSVRQDAGNPSFVLGECKDTIVVKDIHGVFWFYIFCFNHIVFKQSPKAFGHFVCML